MGYERYPRGSNPQGDYDGRFDSPRHGRDDGSARRFGPSGARDAAAAGAFDRDRDDYRGGDGRRDYGYDRDARRDEVRGYGRAPQGGQARYAQGDEFHGSYASDADRDRPYRGDDRAGPGRGGQQGYGRQPEGYEYDDRGFLARAGDEVRSWFGDEDAERRRELDSRYDERAYNDRDSDYHSWRATQIAALDRDYDEYRNENRSKFENEFTNWRTERQTQRGHLGNVQEHAEVVGSDGSHVGTVDKVRGDRILLTKSDPDAGGQHHSIPSRWISSFDGTRVTLSKTAEEAKQQWRAEEKNRALFEHGDNERGASQRNDAGRGPQRPRDDDGGAHTLNRSFPGTY